MVVLKKYGFEIWTASRQNGLMCLKKEEILFKILAHIFVFWFLLEKFVNYINLLSLEIGCECKSFFSQEYSN